MFATVAAGAFIALLAAVLLLHVFGLPANWILLALVALWRWLHPTMDAPLSFFVLLTVLAALGEALEWVTQYFSGKRFGSSPKGMWGAFLGAFAGGILGAPILFGLGALPGSILGAYLGGLLFEILHDRPMSEAHTSAMGNMLGRVLGVILKLSLGIAMLALSAPRIWG